MKSGKNENDFKELQMNLTKSVQKYIQAIYKYILEGYAKSNLIAQIDYNEITRRISYE